MGGATPSTDGDGGGGGVALNTSARSAATPAPSSGTGAGMRSRSSGVGASGSCRIGLTTLGASGVGAMGMPLRRSLNAFPMRFTSRMGISARLAWLRAPPAAISHCLQSGLAFPKGNSKHISQNSPPQRRQISCAVSNVWDRHRPLVSTLTISNPPIQPLPSAADHRFLMSRMSSERVNS